jgi:hypothetical protein
VRNPVRNETSLILVVAVIFSAIAIPVLSGFLEPSQPPAVAAVQIGDPRDRPVRDDGAPRGTPTGEIRTAPARFERRAASARKGKRPTRAAPATPPEPAPLAPADDLAGDDGGEAD